MKHCLKQKSSSKSIQRGRGEVLWEAQRTSLLIWDQKLRNEKRILRHLWKRQILKDELKPKMN